MSSQFRGAMLRGTRRFGRFGILAETTGAACRADEAARRGLCSSSCPPVIALSIVPDALSAIRAGQHLRALFPVQLAAARLGEDGMARAGRSPAPLVR